MKNMMTGTVKEKNFSTKIRKISAETLRKGLAWYINA
ncbi:hypothetical protein IMSAGC013_00928 [Lachnospiraceae bacterium]|nr:hypothetical protein IMSAGC013_00928 [Lachnospiraceae bacterium]